MASRVTFGVGGFFAIRGSRGSPEVATRMKTKILAARSTGIPMKSRRRVYASMSNLR
jgi:hypothetical protein